MPSPFGYAVVSFGEVVDDYLDVDDARHAAKRISARRRAPVEVVDLATGRAVATYEAGLRTKG